MGTTMDVDQLMEMVTHYIVPLVIIGALVAVGAFWAVKSSSKAQSELSEEDRKKKMADLLAKSSEVQKKS